MFNSLTSNNSRIVTFPLKLKLKQIKHDFTYSQIVQISLNKICYFVQQVASLGSIHGPPRTPQFKSFSSCLDSFVYISLVQKKKLKVISI